MIQAQERGTEAWWTETGAEEWADAIVAAMKLGGVDNLFFVSGSELTFYQEAIAKAHAKGRPAPRLVTMLHEHVEHCHQARSEEHTSELQSRLHLVCRLLLEKKKTGSAHGRAPSERSGG